MTETHPKASPEGVPGAVTDPGAVLAQELTYPGAGGDRVNGYLARPAAGGPHPAMVVIHEAGGLGEHIRDVVARFANIGYVTLGVDLYTREGGPPRHERPGVAVRAPVRDLRRNGARRPRGGRRSAAGAR